MTTPRFRRGFIALTLALLLLSTVGASAQDATPTPLPCPPIPSGVQEDFTYYVGQGDSLFNRVLFSDAILSYTCALKLQPDYAPVYVRRGYAYASIGDSDHAIADYEQATTLDEAYIPAYINRGALYTRLGNFGLAINDFTLALSLDPNNVVALNNRAVVEAIEGNYDLALTDLNQAIQLAPQTALPYATRAAVYSALASKDYQQYVTVSQSNRLPAGDPVDVLTAVDDNIRTGDFSIWLSLLTAATDAAH
ncbi:MAG: tetratricopeptide repeat protein [Chloroflexota bacterium]